MATEKSKTVAERVRDARLAKGHSQARAAKSTTLKHQNAWLRLETTGKVKPEHASSVAEYTGIPEYELIGMSTKTVVGSSGGKQVNIPVLSQKEAARLADERVTIADLQATEVITLPFVLEHTRMAFALSVTDDLMSPRFKTGDYVVVDLAGFERIKDNSLVVALTNKGAAVLRRYRVKRSGFELEDNNGERLDSKKDGLILLGPIVKIIQDVQ